MKGIGDRWRTIPIPFLDNTDVSSDQFFFSDSMGKEWWKHLPQPVLSPLPCSILPCPVSCCSLVHLMSVESVFPYCLPPSYYLSVSNLWLIIILPCLGCSCNGDFPEAAQGQLGSLNDQFYHILYRACVSLLEPGLHTINTKCSGDSPDAAQEWPGSSLAFSKAAIALHPRIQ